MSVFIVFSVSDSKHLRTIAAPSISSSLSNSKSSSSSSYTTRIPFVHTTTRAHSVQIISRPTLPTHSQNPSTTNPVHTKASGSHRFQSNQKPIYIAFEVLGGILATGMLFGFLRCCYNYRKTPRRDRIADILHRHNLQRELEELERNPVALRRPFLREPAPPYFPRPPSYEQMNSIPQGIAPPQVDYSVLPTYTPPPSPPMLQRIPLPTHGRPLPDVIRPRPSG